MDLISRQAALDVANDWLLDCFNVKKQDRSCGLIRRLEALPSAHPEEGEWIPVDGDFPYGLLVQCSKCGRRAIINDALEHNYCSECGAKMKK